LVLRGTCTRFNKGWGYLFFWKNSFNFCK
jgi:hypothetical protein